MSAQVQITTIKPTNGLFVSFKPRSKEGENEKPAVYASYQANPAFDSLTNGELKLFCMKAYEAAVSDLLKEAVRANKDSFSIPALGEIYAETKREFLITRKDVEAWLDSFAFAIINKAIATKASLHIDSPKVVRKALQYKEIMLSIAARSAMSQADIDAAIRVLELVSASGLVHPYTDNVAQGIERQQAKLNALLAGKAEEEDIDF